MSLALRPLGSDFLFPSRLPIPDRFDSVREVPTRFSPSGLLTALTRSVTAPADGAPDRLPSLLSGLQIRPWRPFSYITPFIPEKKKEMSVPAPIIPNNPIVEALLPTMVPICCPTRTSHIRALQGVRDAFVLQSVAVSTYKNYGTGIRRWQEFVNLIGSDPFLSKVPPEWQLTNSMPGAIPRPWKEDCITIFLAWMRCEPRPVAPKTAFGYLSAVRFFLLNSGIDVGFLQSNFIRSAKLGMMNAWRLIPGNSEAERRAVPISVDMIMGTKAAFKKPLSLKDLTTYSAMVFGYNTASRCSEYLPASNNVWTHAILSDYVLFLIERHNGRSVLVASHESTRILLSDVLGCLVIIKSAKNDQHGVGHRYYFPKKPVSASRLYDFASDMWNYAQVARPGKSQPFFHCTVPDSWSLTRGEFNKRLKLTARLYKLDPKHVSSHSLRAGAATALGAANVPDYVIKNFGGWSSEAFLRYVRATTQLYEHVHDILASVDGLSLSSLSLVNNLDPSQFLNT